MDKQTIINFAEKLKPDLREVFILNKVENLTLDEISQKLGIQLSETKKRLKQAESWFKRQLSEAWLKKDFKERPEEIYMIGNGTWEWEDSNYNCETPNDVIITQTVTELNRIFNEELHHSMLSVTFSEPEFEINDEDCPEEYKMIKAHGVYTFDINQNFRSNNTPNKKTLIEDFQFELEKIRNHYASYGLILNYIDDNQIEFDPLIDENGFVIADNQNLNETRLKKALSPNQVFNVGDIVQVKPEFYKEIKPEVVNIIKKSVDINNQNFGVIVGSHTNQGDYKPTSYDVRFADGLKTYTYSICPFMLQLLHKKPQWIPDSEAIRGLDPLNEVRLKKEFKTKEQKEIENGMKFINWVTNNFQFDRESPEYFGYINVNIDNLFEHLQRPFLNFIKHIDALEPVLNRKGFYVEKIDPVETIIHDKYIINEARLKMKFKEVYDSMGVLIEIGDFVEVMEPTIYDIHNNEFVGEVVNIDYKNEYITVRDMDNIYYDVDCKNVIVYQKKGV